MHKLSVSSVLLVSLSLIACHGDDGTATIDGGVDIDSPAVQCTVSTPSFGDAGTITGEVSYARFGTANEEYLGMLRLEAGSPFDGLLITLQAGSQNSPGPLVPATFMLTGTESSPTTCGHCVELWTNLVGTTPPEFVSSHDGEYMASGGQLVINSIDHQVGGTLDLTLTDVTLRHMNGSASAGDGCVTAITNAHVIATLVAE